MNLLQKIREVERLYEEMPSRDPQHEEYFKKLKYIVEELEEYKTNLQKGIEEKEEFIRRLSAQLSQLEERVNLTVDSKKGAQFQPSVKVVCELTGSVDKNDFLNLINDYQKKNPNRRFLFTFKRVNELSERPPRGYCANCMITVFRENKKIYSEVMRSEYLLREDDTSVISDALDLAFSSVELDEDS